MEYEKTKKYNTDSYNYFGRDEEYLDEKLLPFVKKGGYIYCCCWNEKRLP